jgi:hypothetical protein
VSTYPDRFRSTTGFRITGDPSWPVENDISGRATPAARRGYALLRPRSWRWKESTEVVNRRSEILRRIIGVSATTQITARTAITTKLTLL